MKIKGYGLKDIIGKKYYQFSLFFIPIITLTRTNKEHTNVYLFFIPLLRIIKSPSKFGINLLILEWIFKTPYVLFKQFALNKSAKGFNFSFNKKSIVELVRQDNIKALKLFGKNVYGVYKRKPFKFPTAMYKG